MRGRKLPRLKGRTAGREGHVQEEKDETGGGEALRADEPDARD